MSGTQLGNRRTTSRMIFLLTASIFLVVAVPAAEAQSPGSGMVFSFPISIPLGEYGENVGTTVGVIDFTWLWGLEGKPVVVGWNIGYILHS